MPKITIPHNWTPEPHQLPVLESPARFKVLVWHRKAHKTTLAINELIRKAFMKKGTYWYVAPFFSQARKIVWEDPEMFAKYVPPQFWEKRNNSELKLRLPNESIIYVLGSDKPDSLRGPNPFGVVLDEYGDMRSDVWGGIIQPIMSANPEAWTWFIGTPKGRNEFWHRMQYAKQNKGTWELWILKASESGIISTEALEEARKTTTAAFYAQEYECEFSEGASAFFRRTRENVWDATSEPISGHTYQLGVDLAKYNDWTVITPFDATTFKAGRQDRFNQIDWNLQKARIQVAWHRFYSGSALIDATGVGDPIVEDLRHAGMSVTPFRFTEDSKRELLTHLAILLEQDKIKIPNDEELLAELDAIFWELGERGKARIATNTGMHDDRVMSLALSVFGRHTPVPRITSSYHEEAPREKYEGTLSIGGDTDSLLADQLRLLGMQK